MKKGVYYFISSHLPSNSKEKRLFISLENIFYKKILFIYIISIQTRDFQVIYVSYD